MPSAPMRPCSYPNCPELTINGRCEQHKADRHRQYDRYSRDKAAKKFYNSAVWQGARHAKYLHDPLCELCKANGRKVEMDVVHHIDGNVWNLKAENLQSLCNSCHSAIEIKRTMHGDHAKSGGV
jgi:5-methylcytosine-specific restriction enzyme A